MNLAHDMHRTVRFAASVGLSSDTMHRGLVPWKRRPSVPAQIKEHKVKQPWFQHSKGSLRFSCLFFQNL